MYLAGAAAVCCVVSIAAFEILMGVTVIALIVARRSWRVPPFWLPLALFFGLTIVSLAACGQWRAGFPQVKKFYVYLMPFLILSAFRTARQLRWVALGWALAASLSSAWALNQFYNKWEDAQDAHVDFYKAYVGDRITGFMSHWMTFSGGMMMALLVIAALIFFSTDRRWIRVDGLRSRADLGGADRRRDAQRVAGDRRRGRVSHLVLEKMGSCSRFPCSPPFFC